MYPVILFLAAMFFYEIVFPVAVFAQWPKGINSSVSKFDPSIYKRLVGGCAVSPRELPTYLPTIKFMSTITRSDPDYEMYRGMENGDATFGLLFDVSPSFGIYDDLKPNAFATPEDIIEDGNEDGAVLVGRNLFASEKRSNPTLWGASMSFVLAHEYAHILQFKRELSEENPYRELHADYLAGWALGKENRKRGPYFTNMGAVVEALLKTGGYAFTDVESHGTPNQRLTALRAGYDAGERNLPLDAAYEAGLAHVRRLSSD